MLKKNTKGMLKEMVKFEAFNVIDTENSKNVDEEIL